MHLSSHPGGNSWVDFPLKTIVFDALKHGSAGIVLAHNHPSGDATPSDADCKATRRLAHVANELDFPVLDHLVFGGTDCTSLRQLGLL